VVTWSSGEGEYVHSIGAADCQEFRRGHNIDLDGDVDHTDSSTISGSYSGITLGRLVLSGGKNRIGIAGLPALSPERLQWAAHDRICDSGKGRFLARALRHSPLVDPVSLYASGGQQTDRATELGSSKGGGGGQAGGKKKRKVEKGEDPCEAALKEQDPDAPPVAMTICVDGKPVICLFDGEIKKSMDAMGKATDAGSSQEALKDFKQCILEHEATHAGQANAPGYPDCPPDPDPSSPGDWAPLKVTPMQEADAYAAEIDCYNWKCVGKPKGGNYAALMNEAKRDACKQYSNFSKGGTYKGCGYPCVK
jgi:hypothetical protein